MSHSEIDTWHHVADHRGLGQEDGVGLLLGLATMLDDRLQQIARAIAATPRFVWLTRIGYMGEVLPKAAIPVSAIVSVAPGTEQRAEDWTHTPPNEREPRIVSWTPGALVDIAGLGENGSAWSWAVQETPEEVIRLCEGRS